MKLLYHDIEKERYVDFYFIFRAVLNDALLICVFLLATIFAVTVQACIE